MKHIPAGHTSYTPPLIRSFPSKVLCHYPENRLSRPFDATAITTVCSKGGLRLLCGALKSTIGVGGSVLCKSMGSIMDW